MAAFLTSDALSTISTSVPDWIQRLDELNSTIAQRQIELAKLTGDHKPPPASVKNKGSTESLRPRDEITTPPQDDLEPLEFPSIAERNELQINDSVLAQSTPAVASPSSAPASSPVELSRKLSLNTPTNQRRFGLRKRKTESMITSESQAPKYRTRSMIIVYYDSTVQAAFEDLVKYISANRNSMRKGKMNAKMEAMKRAAELDAQDDDDDDDDNEEEEYSIPKFTNARSPLGITRTLSRQPRSTPLLPAGPSIEVDKAEVDEDDDEESDLPALKFVSTRNMGPPRQHSMSSGGRLPASLASRNSRLGAASFEINDIFDVLDNGLEWCQGQCERAAHQFLRDGDCTDEITAIKKRLLDVKSKSDVEVERIRKDEAINPRPAPTREIRSRELRGPVMRKATLLSAVKPDQVDQRVGLYGDKARTKTAEVGGQRAADIQQRTVSEPLVKVITTDQNKALTEADNRKLEVDTMEVDEDEGVEADMEIPPMLTFRRTRNMV